MPHAVPPPATCPLALQHELQIRDDQIRHLYHENVRLKVELEQARKDKDIALEAMMVVLRAKEERKKERSVETERGRAEVRDRKSVV